MNEIGDEKLSIFDTTPIMKEEIGENTIDGKTEKIICIRWGDTTFNMLDWMIEDIEVWIHEFTEQAIGEAFKEVEPSIDVGTIAQIIGDADGLKVFWEGKELFCFLHHLLASLATFTFIPAHDGWAKVSGDEMWDIINVRRQLNNAKKS